MLEGTLLEHWKESHKEAPIPALKEECKHPGDTQMLKPPRNYNYQGTITAQVPPSLGPSRLLLGLCKQVTHEYSPADERAWSFRTDFYK